MIRLSIPARQALAKLTLPVLIVAAFGLLLLGKADALLAERARMALADALAPIYVALAEPLGSVRTAIAEVGDLFAGANTSPAGVEDGTVGGLETLLEWAARDERDHGLGEAPYPPEYPKMPGEPPRVQPSKKVAEHWDSTGNRVEP